MAQQQLNIMGYHLLLQEDQMKKEIPDTVSLRCEGCLSEQAQICAEGCEGENFTQIL